MAFQRHRRIDESFAFLTDELPTDIFITSAPSRFAEASSERRLRPCRCFKEQVDLRATARHGLFLLRLPGDSDFLIGKIEKAENVQGR